MPYILDLPCCPDTFRLLYHHIGYSVNTRILSVQLFNAAPDALGAKIRQVMEKNKKKKLADKTAESGKVSKTAVLGTYSGLMRYKPIPMMKGCKNC